MVSHPALSRNCRHQTVQRLLNQKFPGFGFSPYTRSSLTRMPEKTLTQLRRAHVGHSPCLFAHVRALPAVDLEPLPLMPMTNEIPFWWLGLCLPSAAVVTGTGLLEADVTSSFCHPVYRPEHALHLHLLHRPMRANTGLIQHADLWSQTLSVLIRKRGIRAWLKSLSEFPCRIDFSLLHILKVTLIASLCHVAQSLCNPCCVCPLPDMLSLD